MPHDIRRASPITPVTDNRAQTGHGAMEQQPLFRCAELKGSEKSGISHLMSGWLFCFRLLLPTIAQTGRRTMWSLPDIRRLNAEAASATARKTILKAVHQHL